LLIACVYHLCSITNTLLVARTEQPLDHATGRIKATWVFFVIASHAQMMVTIFYWYSEWSPGDPVEFSNISSHGVVMILTWLDGIVVNRIPIRFMHFWGLVVPYDLSYIMWTVLHALANIGNPNKSDNDPNTNDDAIYGSTSWKTNTGAALVTVFSVILVASPLVFLLQRSLTMYSRPFCCGGNRLRYVEKTQTNAEGLN
jgi:hypothetical protein